MVISLKADKHFGLYSIPKFICNQDTLIKFKGYPVYILNNTQKQKAIFLKSIFIEITQEAIDKNGKWQPIEKTSAFRCGFGFGWIGLKSNEYLVTSIYKYKGDFNTLLRIKFVNGKTTYYSKPFNGSINYSQLNQKTVRYIDGLPYEK